LKNIIYDGNIDIEGLGVKKKTLITLVLVMFIALIILGSVVIYFRNRNLNNDNIYFPEDVYTLAKLSDEEYNKLSESIISQLEYAFGKEGGFEIKNIEKGFLEIGDVATPQSYQEAEVYSNFLDDTFDGEPSSFIFKLLQKYEDELNNKIKEINENMNVSIVKYTSSVTNYGHIPTLEEIPNENYSILLYYTSKNEKISSNNIDNVINTLRTDLKDAYYIILEKDSSYKSRNFKIRYVVDNSAKNYKYITISINPNAKIINLEGYNIEIPNKEINWNEIF